MGQIIASTDNQAGKGRIVTGSLIPLRIVILLFFFAFILMFFLTLPIISLFSSFTLDHFFTALRSPHFSKSLILSIMTTFTSAGIIFLFGTPLAYIMARFHFKGKGLLDLLIDVPMVIPPSVAGIGLLLAFGRRGMLGGWLNELGISISFTTAAVIFAQVFIAAPFYLRSARSGFMAASEEMEKMARSLGANWQHTFVRVTLPLAKPYLITGLITSWARALGEFGATMMFAGNFIGKTETLPLAIYSAMNEDLGVAIVLANILLMISLLLMLFVRIFSSRGGCS